MVKVQVQVVQLGERFFIGHKQRQPRLTGFKACAFYGNYWNVTCRKQYKQVFPFQYLLQSGQARSHYYFVTKEEAYAFQAEIQKLNKFIYINSYMLYYFFFMDKKLVRESMSMLWSENSYFSLFIASQYCRLVK